MKWPLTISWSGHPIAKFGLYAHLICVGLWGPIVNVGALTVAVFVFLLLIRDDDCASVSPWFAFLVCMLSVLIVIPGGTAEQMVAATALAIRLLQVMLVSVLFGRLIYLEDVIRLQRLMRMPEVVALAIIVTARFIPVAIHSMRSVLFAQRARGLRMVSLLKMQVEAYNALLIPYLLAVMRRALTMWIANNLRPISQVRIEPATLRLSDVFLAALSSVLWIDVAWLY